MISENFIIKLLTEFSDFFGLFNRNVSHKSFCFQYDMNPEKYFNNKLEIAELQTRESLRKLWTAIDKNE